MNGVPVAPRRVFGVTLACGSDAGHRTWVCRAHPGAEGIRVESVETLARLPGGAIDRDGVCRSLVGKVLEAPRSAWGFDFAFGLPVASSGRGAARPPAARDTWAGRLDDVADAVAPEDLLDGRDPERRRTDRERGLRGPLQEPRLACTWTGARAILRPLRVDQRVVLLPFDPLPRAVEGMPSAMQARVGNIYVMEVAPSAALLAAGVQEEPPDPEQRMTALRALVAHGWVRPLARALREHVADHPGGLAAVACAVAAWRGYREYDHAELGRDGEYGVEGHAYS